MKRLFINSIIVLSLFFAHILSVQAAEIYKLDPMHSFIVWRINHLGFSVQYGKFTNVEGTLTIDEAKPQNSKVEVTIPIDKVVTGIPKLDEHLKSADFFNVEKFPTASFISNKVIVTGKNKGKVFGTLTMHGISKPVVLDVTLLKKGMHPLVNKQSLGFQASAKLKRSDFDMKTHLPSLGDEIEIDIGTEANLTN